MFVPPAHHIMILHPHAKKSLKDFSSPEILKQTARPVANGSRVGLRC
jgi:hypothetical protein